MGLRMHFVRGLHAHACNYLHSYTLPYLQMRTISCWHIKEPSRVPNLLQLYYSYCQTSFLSVLWYIQGPPPHTHTLGAQLWVILALQTVRYRNYCRLDTALSEPLTPPCECLSCQWTIKQSGSVATPADCTGHQSCSHVGVLGSHSRT